MGPPARDQLTREGVMRYPQYRPALLVAVALIGCDRTSTAPLTAPDVVPGASVQSLITDAVVTLDPVVAVDAVGTPSTVYARVTGAEGPVAGVTVVSDITGAFGFRAPFACITDASGQCPITYTFESVDVHTIRACIEGLTTRCGEATKVWMEPVAPGKVTGGGWFIVVGAPTVTQLEGSRVTFGFTAQLDEGGCHARGAVRDHETKMLIKILDCATLVVEGTHATFTGTAEIDGVETMYVIDVDDITEPGTLDTFTIEAGAYFASGVLEGGNIQIHKQ
jgi:hypothetical protein